MSMSTLPDNKNERTSTNNFRIRRRPVSFGNPALGTYHGCIYNLQQKDQQQHHNESNSSSRYGSYVKGYIQQSSVLPRPIIEGAIAVQRLVAMVDVPPEQVPDGILNLARPYRPWIYHVRIVIGEHGSKYWRRIQRKAKKETKQRNRAQSTTSLKSTHSNEATIQQPQQEVNHRYSNTSLPTYDSDDQYSSTPPSTSYSIPLSPTVTAAENAASILAREQVERESSFNRMQSNNEQDTSDEEEIDSFDDDDEGDDDDDDNEYMYDDDDDDDNNQQSDNDFHRHSSNGEIDYDNSGNVGDNFPLPDPRKQRSQTSLLVPNLAKNIPKFKPRDRTYVALIELCSDDAADQFVNDLHQEPYTILDETEVCSVYHVVAIQGKDGVSLISPFFASSSKTTTGAAAGQSSTTPTSGSNNNSSRINPQPSPNISQSGSNLEITASASSTSSKSNTTTSIAIPRPRKESDAGASSNIIDDHYNCAVCLERIDLDHLTSPSPTNDQLRSTVSSSILTTVCNHTFHLDCLLQWQDSPCPVCRYDHSGLNEALSQCHICGTTENNYVCLICGVVSCGDGLPNPTVGVASAAGATTSAVSGYNNHQNEVSSTVPLSSNQCSASGPVNDAVVSQQRAQPLTTAHSHARNHYDQTLHAYALNTETQHVWDFAGQGYVHRLLQNKDDGKLVEVNDPNNTSSQERTLSPGLTDAQEGEVVHRKLEGFATQYYTLLKSQLEQQRIYYEGRLQEIRREYGVKDGNSRKSHGKAGGSMTIHKKESSDLIHALKQERAQLRNRLHGLQCRLEKVKDDVAFLINMNESLEANRGPLKEQLEQAKQDQIEQRNMFEQCIIPPLEERVTQLMLQLETGGGTASVAPDNSSSNSNHRDKKPAARKK